MQLEALQPGPMSQYTRHPGQPAGRPHRPDVRDRRRQTDVRRASSLNAPAYGAGA